MLTSDKGREEPISIVIITHNESNNIEACLKSCLPLSDDIVIIDANSNDGTVEIASSFTDQIYILPWAGFGQARNEGARHAKNKWILSIDADERPDEEMISSIRNTFLNEDTIYRFTRRNHLGDTLISFGEWMPEKKERLYHKDKAYWNTAPVHERLILHSADKKVTLKGFILHYSYRNTEELEHRLDKYARLSAVSTDRPWNAFYAMTAGLKSILRFLKGYILKGGILDGLKGWKIAQAYARYEWKKYRFKFRK